MTREEGMQRLASPPNFSPYRKTGDRVGPLLPCSFLGREIKKDGDGRIPVPAPCGSVRMNMNGNRVIIEGNAVPVFSRKTSCLNF